MKISRKYARVSIIAIIIALVLIAICLFTNNVIYLYIAAGFIAASFIIKFFILKCPNCGWGGAPPQWSKSGTIHCPKCGKALEYDDE